MALATGAFNRTFNDDRPKRVFPLLREQTYAFDYLGITEKQEVAFEDRNKPAGEQKLVDRVEFKFVMVLPGADEAQTAMEALNGAAREKAFETFKTKYLDKGHGRFFWITCNKSISKGGNGKKASNAYLVIRGLLNDGDDLTPEQMGQIVELLNALEAETPRAQFYGYVTADKAKNRNALDRVSGRVPEDEVLPSWRAMARIVDPREADDDASLVCAECGEHLHGYEISMGDRKGEWVTNTEAAESSIEKYGKALCGKHIRAAKQALAASPAASAEKKLPF